MDCEQLPHPLITIHCWTPREWVFWRAPAADIAPSSPWSNTTAGPSFKIKNTPIRKTVLFPGKAMDPGTLPKWLAYSPQPKATMSALNFCAPDLGCLRKEETSWESTSPGTWFHAFSKEFFSPRRRSDSSPNVEECHSRESRCLSWQRMSHKARQTRVQILIQSIKVKMKIAQLCLTLCDPMDCIVHGILQARILEWVAFPFSRRSS